MPTAFLLPQDYGAFASYIRSTAASGVWALKEDVHRGTGVVAVPGRHALRRALDKAPPKKKGAPAQHKFVMAQQFIDEQVLINNRPFVMRLWAVIAGGNPVTRAYLFSGGIIIFGSEQQPSSGDSKSPNNDISRVKDRAQGLIVNLFQQNRSATIDPWSIADLRAHLHTTTGSDTAFNTMWDTLEKSTAAALAAAVPSMRRATSLSSLRLYQGGNVEILGLDFVIDSHSKPWLVEVNYLPSMARKVINCVPSTTTAQSNPNPLPLEQKKEEKGGTTGQQPEICKDNPMDMEKESFLAAYLRVLAARQAGIESHVAAATAAVEQRAQQQLGKDRCKLTAELLRQILDAEIEWQAAKDHGFSDLTPQLYTSLQCISGNMTACTFALPTTPEEVCQEPTRSERWHAVLEWSMAQVRRAILGVDIVLQGLVKRPPRPVVTPKYFPLPSDKLITSWLKLPKEERQGDSNVVLNKLCSLELS